MKHAILWATRALTLSKQRAKIAQTFQFNIMTKSTQQILAFTWYHESDYRRLLKESSDHKGLHPDYSTWLAAARKALLGYKKLGFRPQRVYIDVQEYIDWCALRERAVDQHSRELFKEIKRQEFYRELEAYERKIAGKERKHFN